MASFGNNYLDRTAGLRNFIAPVPPFSNSAPVSGGAQSIAEKTPLAKFLDFATEAFTPGHVQENEMQAIAPPAAAPSTAPAFRNTGLGAFLGSIIPGVNQVYAAQDRSALSNYANNLPDDPMEALKGMMAADPYHADKYAAEILQLTEDRADPIRQAQLATANIGLENARADRGRQSALAKLFDMQAPNVVGPTGPQLPEPAMSPKDMILRAAQIDPERFGGSALAAFAKEDGHDTTGLPEGMMWQGDRAVPIPGVSVGGGVPKTDGLPDGFMWQGGQAVPIPGLSDGAAAANSGLTGQAYLDALSPERARRVKATAEGNYPLPSTRSKDYEQVMSDVLQYDPSANAFNLPTRAATRKAFTSGVEARQANALNTVIGHIASLGDKIDSLENTSFMPYNFAKNVVAKATGDADITNFQTNAKSVADEVVKVWRASGGSVHDIEEAQKALESSQSPAQLRGGLETLGDLLHSKINALNDQYAKGMGLSSAEHTLLTPEAKASLKKLGIAVDDGALPIDVDPPPEGISQEAWVHMTPAERAKFK